MAQERESAPPSTNPDANDASGSSAAANNPLPYGYVPAGAAGSRARQPPPRYYGREDTPHPDPLRRHLPPPPARPPGQSAATVGPTNAATQPPPPPPPPRQTQQQQGRVVFESRVPMHLYNAGDYAAHAALMASNVQTMVPVVEEPAVAQEPQQTYKKDVEAAKAVHKLSRDAWAEERRRNNGS